MTITVKVEGLRDIQRALHDLPKKATAKNIMKRVLMNRAEPVARAARANVPVEEGWLRESIDVSTKLSPRQRRMHRKPHRDEVEVFIGPGPDPAAHLQEFGSSRHRAQPFLRPAWDGLKRSVLDKIGDDMWAEIQKAAARHARKLARLAKKAAGG
jgi:HK97 gp10 family phage protein